MSQQANQDLIEVTVNYWAQFASEARRDEFKKSLRRELLEAHKNGRIHDMNLQSIWEQPKYLLAEVVKRMRRNGATHQDFTFPIYAHTTEIEPEKNRVRLTIVEWVPFPLEAGKKTVDYLCPGQAVSLQETEPKPSSEICPDVIERIQSAAEILAGFIPDRHEGQRFQDVMQAIIARELQGDVFQHVELHVDRTPKGKLAEILASAEVTRHDFREPMSLKFFR